MILRMILAAAGAPIRRLPRPLVDVLRAAAYVRHDLYTKLVWGNHPVHQERHSGYVRAFYDNKVD